MNATAAAATPAVGINSAIPLEELASFEIAGDATQAAANEADANAAAQREAEAVAAAKKAGKVAELLAKLAAGKNINIAGYKHLLKEAGETIEADADFHDLKEQWDALLEATQHQDDYATRANTLFGNVYKEDLQKAMLIEDGLRVRRKGKKSGGADPLHHVYTKGVTPEEIARRAQEEKGRLQSQLDELRAVRF